MLWMPPDQRPGFLCLLVLAAASLVSCSVLPNPNWAPDVLFRDDFSVLGGEWSRLRDSSGITDYDQNGYRIQVLQPDTHFWSHPGLKVQDVRVEVEARPLGGPEENLFGVLCRYQDDKNFYYFLIGTDGFFILGKYKHGAQSFLGLDTFGFHPALQESQEVYQLRVDCVRENLTLFVNEIQIVTVQDHDFVQGDVGLIAGTLETPGTDVLFDNFVVRKP
jgi:hypothetical protein